LQVAAPLIGSAGTGLLNACLFEDPWVPCQSLLSAFIVCSDRRTRLSNVGLCFEDQVCGKAFTTVDLFEQILPHWVADGFDDRHYLRVASGRVCLVRFRGTCSGSDRAEEAPVVE
jgi:hypothetical protein